MTSRLSNKCDRAVTEILCRFVVAAAVFAVLIPLSSFAQESGRNDPAPLEVRIFDGQDFTGAARSLTLEPGMTYGYFERLDTAQISKARSLKAGAAVGAVLFRGAYFVSRDQSCAPTLGSDENPDLIWHGATADFLPAQSGKTGVGNLDDAGGEGYASAIVFLRAAGPPPGALLMKRRRSYGKGCGNILRSLNFDRRFVPMGFESSLAKSAERAPKTRGCVNLRGAKVALPEGGASARLSDMLKSDRIALLQPSDLDRRYESQERAFRAVLFEGENCQGESVTLDAPDASSPSGRTRVSASARRDLLLSDYLFRDRVRSLRVEAAGGTSEASARAVAPDPERNLKTAKIQTKNTPTKSAPTTTAGATTAGAVTAGTTLASKIEPIAPDAKAEQPTLDQMKATAIAPKAETGLSTAKLEPMTDLPPQPETSAVSVPDEAAAKKAAVPAVAVTASPVIAPQPIPSSQASSPDAGKVMTPDVRFAGAKPASARTSAARTSAAEVPRAQQQKNAPQKIQANQTQTAQTQTAQTGAVPQSDAPASADPTSPGEEVFAFPVYDVYRLNYCLRADGGCGEEAASKWCELKGFKRATAWQKDDNIGGIFPTFLIGESRICAQYKCDGFAEITCGN
ncbi:beta/gamma crystallin family protein [Denitrobaculum tricleocarpae]|uniref:Beta/gamma crystallin family protein n=1 Tax=Denitrobaculum tricleocarpae TaxID=2591009 RepID=A0A545TQX6_9PROT|nr:beta/gamma crystallin family protein [Denitrobaculum tricleocarpae]TQV79625.1 beta/gamma crystallin family protein [Denitrobaculum tricleocarpae]